MTITRRQALGGAAALAAAPPAPGRSLPSREKFLWGVATAAHQIEGNNVNSDYWVLENVTETGFHEPSFDACDSWDRWPEDIALVRAMGLNAYRFSIEWARIEPERGYISRAVLDHYRRQIAACREAGIAPIVTFHHFTSPRWVAALGGWENPGLPDLFARYCDVAARALGDMLDWGCTINEPNGQVNSYIVAGHRPFAREAVIRAAAAKAVGSDRFSAFFQGDGIKVRDITIAAHAKGRDAIKAAAPHMRVGITLALQDLVAGPDGADMYRQLFDEARAPYYAACDHDDFIGVQPYNRLTTTKTGYVSTPAGDGPEAWREYSDPGVLAAVIREVHRHCRAPVLITENGIRTTDETVRITHLTESVAGLQRCRADGIPVLGYIYWSLIDNFEWSSGYVPRFGLYECDRTTFARTPKASAAAYRRLVARHRAAT